MPRPYLKVEKFKAHVLRRLINLRAIYEETSWRAKPERTLVLGSLVIELDNLVVQAFKGYVTTLVWQAQKSGRLPKPGRGYSSFRDYDRMVLTARAIAAAKPGRKPKIPKADARLGAIRNPKDLELVILQLVQTTTPEFSNALALNHTAFTEIRDFRHFYAHRCTDTLEKAALNAPIFATKMYRHPDEFVDGVPLGRTATKFQEWWSDIFEFFQVIK